MDELPQWAVSRSGGAKLPEPRCENLLLVPAGVLTDSLEQVVADVLLPGLELATGVTHVLHSLREANLLQIPLRKGHAIIDVFEADVLGEEAEQGLPLPHER